MDQENEIDALLEKANIEYMLEFETQIFLETCHKDGLVIAAKGLNLDLVVLNILKVYCDPGNLVIVLNASEGEEKYFYEKLQSSDVHINNSTTIKSVLERQDGYLSGGIHFITTRILVIDMLKNRLPIDKVTGFIVLRAHRILESCQEAFVLRLYRQNNKTGFIKAFSNSPQSFTMGFGHVERVMRTIFVKELYIWPRFHSLVVQSLKKYQPQVIELHIPISEKMRRVQTHILELMNMTVKEIKRLNKTVEIQEITVENCLTKKFHKILQAQLDLVWHQLSSRSRQLVLDLKTLRHLMNTLFYSDCVSFYSILSGYRSMEYAQKATWVLSEAAELLFRELNTLIFSGDKELNPEMSPKWEALLEILKVEIPAEVKKSNAKDNTVLILCSDNRTCYQLNQVLTCGAHYYLFSLALKKKVPFKSLNKLFKNCGNLSAVSKQQEQLKTQPKSSKSNKKAKTDNEEEENEDKNKSEKAISEDDDGDEEFQNTYVLTMSETFLEHPELIDKNDSYSGSSQIFEQFSQMENLNLTQIIESLTVSAPKILIQTFKGGENYISLQNTLETIKPNFIILYETNMTAVREIEMYEAHRQKQNQLKIYFLIHAETVEEQSYLTSLRREKEAFEYLIDIKSKMVVPEDQDGKTDQCLALQRELQSPTKNTRQGGSKDTPPPKKFIIVDIREFRSELPALIHKRGIELEPLTITVGDYVLTPDICVERKSISDLIGSLNSGRLFQQCKQMFRYYSKPMLLIEFSQNKPFSWQNHYMLSSDECSADVQQKLLLLTIHFPKLKIIWSPNPYATAQLFEELKQDKEEPNIEYAAAIGGDDLDIIEAKFNAHTYDFVQKLPGITTKNINQFMRKFNSLDEVITKSEEEIKDVLGNSTDAKALYSVLHKEHTAALEEPKQKGKSKSGYNKFRSKRPLNK